ncbi:hypothetical protein I8746_10565 [Pseudomonas sp. USTB-Z]|uniref:hypothetical protein n=1 Tax=Pseudomonas sp. USTB-Z TaxID=2794351 RepID=UPI001C83BE26|nr:hypothetical protein [Pseudomonas sp. USTB-Z]MBX6690045.1 hypothetical protein [Pseudomonas sp. USTB-Z]
MKASTIDNIQKRYEWLNRIFNGKIKISQTQQSKLTDMRSFCDLEVSNTFQKISYNTLKNFCINNRIPGVDSKIENHWEHLLSLREKIHTTFITKTSTTYTLAEPTTNEKINEAFNQAQLAAIAYLELFQFIKQTTESDTSLSDATRQNLSNFLYESNLKFENITSYTQHNPKPWSVIQGGKTGD